MNTKKEMIRFYIAGLITGATDFGIYFLLIRFMPFSLAKGISFICAGIVGYIFNKYWIFSCNQPSYAEVGRYLFINVLALCINVLVNQRLLIVWPGAVLVDLVMASALTGAFTFVCYKWWVFRVLLQEGVSFVWWKWFPWRLLVKDAARRHGFLDPDKILAALQNFAQPSEVVAPLELVRSGVVLHARGLVNSLAIQHNLDWIWPFWVECQYDPRNPAFIPRSFSLTQINLTHRNWTALGVPDCAEFPLVDPRGLVTPFYDSWSIDFWLIPDVGEPLIPSRCLNVVQKIILGEDLGVSTEITGTGQGSIVLKAQVTGSALAPVCRIIVTGFAHTGAQLVVVLRPYNPEGISFINNIDLLAEESGWVVNKELSVYLDKKPSRWVFSDYQRGDVYSRLSSPDKELAVTCNVGLATAAAVYVLAPGKTEAIVISVPLTKVNVKGPSPGDLALARSAWKESLQGVCKLQVPNKHFQFLYDSALHTMVLHSPKEVYPGPYIYRRFWFRDAAFILQALLCVGLKSRVRRALDCFQARQTAQGYFLSQEGEWDSNGEALWIMRQYCEKTGLLPPKEWKDSIYKAGVWIANKRLALKPDSPHAGLLPSGFSAEHLGPNDFYYWDDFWGVAGLNAAAFLADRYEDKEQAEHFKKKSIGLACCIEQSTKTVEKRLKRRALPASPYRRMDSGAIGSLVASYPLQVFGQNDDRIMDTAEYLLRKCLVQGGFFHDMTHSGINPYLTLHLAQVLLRAGDPRYFGLMTAVANWASSTGQWPESIHPRTGGGCMGDGQHVWAAAEWVLMIRNCFVREESDRLVLCSGIPMLWLEQQEVMSFGAAPTAFGDINIKITPQGARVLVEWSGQWFTREPDIDIHLPGFRKVRVALGTANCTLVPESGV
ncbi:MAG: GtrA family protein [Candidatus Omnitrophica bacterium]|nr:GtrA family protein [Candidatus Omnitrophota bacterium]